MDFPGVVSYPVFFFPFQSKSKIYFKRLFKELEKIKNWNSHTIFDINLHYTAFYVARYIISVQRQIKHKHNKFCFTKFFSFFNRNIHPLFFPLYSSIAGVLFLHSSQIALNRILWKQLRILGSHKYILIYKINQLRKKGILFSSTF